jgi:hypothetical protein
MAGSRGVIPISNIMNELGFWVGGRFFLQGIFLTEGIYMQRRPAFHIADAEQD